MSTAKGRTRALVVEDSATQAMELRILLESAGFDVRIAGRLSEALERLSEQDADVVLLDLELPDATGLSGLERLSGHESRVAVVVLTATEDEATALEAIEKGAEDYLFKGQLGASALVRSVRYAMERRRAHNELAVLTEELRRSNAQKDQFLGIAAHDVRNPLSVVRGYADFLLAGAAGPVNEEQVEILRSMRRSADFMLRLVEDLLDFSRIQSDRLEVEREPVRLGELVQRVVSVNRMLAQKKDIDLRLAHLDDVPEMLLDEHKIEQVLDNLLTNAVKFSHRGTSIDVRVEHRGGAAVLSVRDRGVGIPPDDLPKVFAPFEKTRARPTGGERSTGLGLAIVRNIVEAHRGTIDVESEPGVGSTFTVRLPYG